MNEKQRILVVDDDGDCLEFAKMVLEAEGFDVITATGGEEGLEKAVSQHPDLIVLDVMMGEQDGWDTCDKIKSLEGTSKIPIVYLTCLKAPSSVYQPHGAFETDWDEYLTKPVTPEQLVTTTKKLLQKSAATP